MTDKLDTQKQVNMSDKSVCFSGVSDKAIAEGSCGGATIAEGTSNDVAIEAAIEAFSEEYFVKPYVEMVTYGSTTLSLTDDILREAMKAAIKAYNDAKGKDTCSHTSVTAYVRPSQQDIGRFYVCDLCGFSSELPTPPTIEEKDQ